MSKPTVSDVHVNAALTQIAVAHFQTQTTSVFDKVFPIVNVSKQSDSFHKWSLEDLTRIEAQERGPGAVAAEAGIGLSQQTYSCLQYALRSPIEDEMRDNADDAVDPERAKAMYLATNIAARLEKKWAAAYFTTGVWDTDLTLGTKWSAGGSSPILDIHQQITSMRRKTGYKPNTLVLGPDTFDVLINHADIIDRIKHTSRDVPMESTLASLFRVSRVLVGDMMETSSAEGAASATQADILDSDAALLCYSAPSPSRDLPSAGYSFAWNRPGSSGGMRTLRYRVEERHSDFIEVQADVDCQVVSSALGVFIPDAVD